MPATPHTPGSSSNAGGSKINCSPSQFTNNNIPAGIQSNQTQQQQVKNLHFHHLVIGCFFEKNIFLYHYFESYVFQYLKERNPNNTQCHFGNQFIDGGNCTNPHPSYPVSNNQQTTQSINNKTLNDADNSIGSAPSNIPNNGSSSNVNNANQPPQDFNLDDLNFDPASLIGGNGENTDLNVSLSKYCHVDVLALFNF